MADLIITGDAARNVWLMVDDALDDLPRFFAVADQPADGVDGLAINRPHMKCCVSVDDVRRMLRQKLSGVPASAETEGR